MKNISIFDFVNKIKANNGECYFVGGYVRDIILNKIPHDKDILVVGINQIDFEKEFPDVQLIGKSFPVYLLKIDNELVEVAFARKERKESIGYTGFSVDFSNKITLEEDLYRRDTTMNSLAQNINTGEIIDLFGGITDIKNKEIKAVSEYFSEDPVRSLRVARQSAQFDFTVEKNTISLMKKTKNELIVEPKDRIFNELKKVLTSSKKPSIFFRVLLEADLLDITFPEIYQLVNKYQPIQYHPEGDAFEHTMLVLDKVSTYSTDPMIRFCSLMHDIGKGATPFDLLPKHYLHDLKGVEIIENLPSVYLKKWKNSAKFVAEEHMRINNIKNPGKIVKFFLKIKRAPIDIEDFKTIIMVDQNKVPWFLSTDIYNKFLAEQIIIPNNIKKDNIKKYVFDFYVKNIKRYKKEEV